MTIEWVDVESLTSIQLFDVERDDGTRVSGHLDVGTTPETLIVRTGREQWLEIPFAEVYYIRQLGSSIWRSRRGRLNAGLDYAHASESADSSLDGDLTFQGKRFTWTSTATASISDDADRDARERVQVDTQLEVAAGRHFEWVGRTSFQKNDDLDLDSRVTASGAFLWLPVRSARQTFFLGAGVGQSEERYRGETEGQSVTGGLLYTGYEYHRFGTYGTTARFELTLIPMLTGPERHRVELRSTFTQKFTTNFNFTISPYYSFDSRPPRASAEHEDWGWISSIGWSF